MDALAFLSFSASCPYLLSVARIGGEVNLKPGYRPFIIAAPWGFAQGDLCMIYPSQLPACENGTGVPPLVRCFSLTGFVWLWRERFAASSYTYIRLCEKLDLQARTV